MKAKIAFRSYRALVLLVAAAIASATLVVPAQITYVDLLVAIIGVAGVVVTVFGIWIAVIFPRFVASLGDGVPLGKADDANRYAVLLKSLYRAALVLVASLFILVIVTFFANSSSFLRLSACFFCLLCLISLAESLFASIVNGELSASDVINNGVVVGVVRRRRRRATGA